ncbi:MAG: response regulator [Synechococcaceae cyanobacterium RL_1_2]|nr:response regulator [Synechococcaceae cyanobacterium RL_1_2]
MAAAPPAAKSRQTQNKVLIIDDSVTVRELLSMTFRNAGYEVEQARDGEDAWKKLNEDPTIDVAFCDIEMPKLNGLDLLSRIQEDQSLTHIPIAMLTSRGAQKMQKIAADRGAKGYFVKPYLEEVLLDAAAKMIEGENLLAF